MKKLVIIDGHSIINRAFYGVPDLTNSSGLHTNAIYGFLNIMFKILDEEKADYLAVAFDLPKPTFRHIEYTEYKGNRKSMPDELREQVPVLQEVLCAMNIPIITCEGFEADDIIGTLAKRYQSLGLSVAVISGDRDLLQISDENIKIRIPKSSNRVTEIIDYYPEDVLREYLVTPKEFIDLKALMGDKSDNIPGVPSIGIKTATDIITKFKSIENAYEHVDELPKRAAGALRDNYDKAKLSKYLATIKTDVDIDIDLESMKLQNIFNKESFKYIKNLEFKSFEKKFSDTDLNDEIEKKDIRYIKSKKEARAVIDKLSACKKIGLGYVCSIQDNPFETESVECLGAISISEDENISYVISRNEDIDNEDLNNYVLALTAKVENIYIMDLKPLIKLLDIKDNKNIRDICVGAYLLNPLKESYFYDDIARDYLGINIQSKDKLLGKKDAYDELALENSSAIEYMGYLSLVSYSAGDIIMSALVELEMKDLYFDIELPLIYSLARMELAGIGVDAAGLEKYSKELEAMILTIENEIYIDAGEKFNINSPKQLGEILFGKLDLEGGKKTKTGYSTAADVLEKLATKHPIVKKILKYRQLTKLNSTYALGLGAYIGSDGRIHGKFNQTITATGRISSTEPNLQNIPIRTEMGSKIRDIFVAKEGYVFVDADYSQIELRVLASMSNDENLIESYKESADIHTITASKVFHVPISEVTPLLRRNAKAVNFGVVYGISAFSLSEDLSISRKDALDYINNYFRTYPMVKSFLDAQVKKAKEDGYVKTLYNRIRPIPEIKSSNFNQRAFGDRVAMNSPIQGTAADIMKLAMINVDRELEKSGLDARIVLQVHDELLVEVKESDALEAKKIVENTMREVTKLAVSLEVEAHIGKTWLQAK